MVIEGGKFLIFLGALRGRNFENFENFASFENKTLKTLKFWDFRGISITTLHGGGAQEDEFHPLIVTTWKADDYGAPLLSKFSFQNLQIFQSFQSFACAEISCKGIVFRTLPTGVDLLGAASCPRKNSNLPLNMFKRVRLRGVRARKVALEPGLTLVLLNM